MSVWVHQPSRVLKADRVVMEKSVNKGIAILENRPCLLLGFADGQDH